MSGEVSLIDHIEALLAERTRHMDKQLNDLERHLTAQITALEAKTDAGFRASNNAVIKAENAVDRRLEGMNEFRESLRDQNAEFVRKVEFAPFATQVNEIVQEQRKLEGRIWGIGATIAMIVTIVQIVIRFLPTGG